MVTTESSLDTRNYELDTSENTSANVERSPAKKWAVGLAMGIASMVLVAGTSSCSGARYDNGEIKYSCTGSQEVEIKAGDTFTGVMEDNVLPENTDGRAVAIMASEIGKYENLEKIEKGETINISAGGSQFYKTNNKNVTAGETITLPEKCEPIDK